MNDIQSMLDTIRASVHGTSSQKFRARFGTSDVTQESAVQFIQEFRKRAEQNIEPTITRKWLKLIGMGTAWKLRRKHSAICRTVTAETPSDIGKVHSRSHANPEAAAIFNEMSANLVYAIGKLDSVERRVIDHFYNKHMTISEIARSLDTNTKKVQRVHASALSKLKAELAESCKEN